MTEINIKIDGMSCQHCVMRVKKAIDAVAGVLKSDIAIGSATIQFDESKTKEEDIVTVIEKAGHKVIG